MAGQRSILLAEDNKADVFLVRRSLEEHAIGHELRVAHDGEEALRLIDEIRDGEEPVLLLIDLNLPRVSGQEILGQLKNKPRCGDVPVIVLTSSDSPADRAEAARLGARAYFRKPSKLDEFMQLGAMVRQVLDGESGKDDK